VQAPGLLKKFKGRALLLITGACAIHCRYCFRRYFPYAEGTIQADGAGAALDTLAKDASVSEVILSGGDPLMLDDSVLSTLIGRLEQLPHLKRLRLHTRMPIVLPSRITTRLCEALSGSRLQSSIVVHVNHSRELESEAHAGLGRLRQAGITLLNQSVLLKGVNDSEHSLTELSEALFECGVLPYYLHMLDRVAGTAHFDLDDTKAVVLLDRLRAQLPGYLVPRLVREQSGCPYKTPIESRQGTMRRTEDISYGALDAEHR
jgi:EF-P beta-lysylation protein EpmB